MFRGFMWLCTMLLSVRQWRRRGDNGNVPAETWKGWEIAHASASNEYR